MSYLMPCNFHLLSAFLSFDSEKLADELLGTL